MLLWKVGGVVNKMVISMKRTILLICYMILAGFLAFIEATDTLAILTGIGGVLLACIGIKGQNVQK